MLTWILLLRCHYVFSDRTSVFSFLLISFLLSAILLPSFLLSFPCSFQLVSILPVVPCSLALRPSLLFRYPLQLSSLVYPTPFYMAFPCVFFLPQYVYIASHYLSLYRVLWLFYAILYNLIRFITYYNATMATTTDTTIASATIATNTLAIAVTPTRNTRNELFRPCQYPILPMIKNAMQGVLGRFRDI